MNLGRIGQELFVGEHAAVAGKLLDGTVTECDGLIEVEPGVAQQVVAWVPGVTVHVLPQFAIVPVVSSGGEHGFVGSEDLEIVDPSTGALQALSVGSASYIII